MKIKFLAAVGLMLVSGMAFGSDVYVYNGKGTNPIKLMQDVKKITFTENAMTVIATEAEETVNFADFTHFTFSPEKEGAVAELQADGTVKVFTVGNILTVKAAQPIANVTVYSMQGSKLMELQPMQSEVSQSIENCQAGIYLVKVVAGSNESVYKIIKR